MLYLITFILGFFFALFVTKDSIKIDIHHTNEDIKETISESELEKLQEKMLKEDPKNDKLYEEIDTVLTEVNDVMGGSDRVV